MAILLPEAQRAVSKVVSKVGRGYSASLRDELRSEVYFLVSKWLMVSPLPDCAQVEYFQLGAYVHQLFIWSLQSQARRELANIGHLPPEPLEDILQNNYPECADPYDVVLGVLDARAMVEALKRDYSNLSTELAKLDSGLRLKAVNLYVLGIFDEKRRTCKEIGEDLGIPKGRVQAALVWARRQVPFLADELGLSDERIELLVLLLTAKRGRPEGGV